MSKYTTVLAIALLVGAPSTLFAAFDDATFPTDTVIQMGSISLNVSGASAVLASLAVTDSDFTATLSPGSSLVVTSSDRKLFTTSASASGVNIGGNCESSNSTLSLIYPTGSGSAITITATPSGTCATAPSTSTGTGSGSSGGGGGGGGGGSTVTTTTTTTTTAKTTATTPAVTTTTQSPAVSSQVSAVASAASSSARPSATAVLKSPVFTQPLTNGSRSSQVLELQRILNSDPETRISASGAGSPGKETTLIGQLTIKAIKKFQLKHGIAKPGDGGFGFVGPKTRAKLNQLAGAKAGVGSSINATPTVVTPAKSSASAAPSASALQAQRAQITALLEMVKKLQSQLKSATQ